MGLDTRWHNYVSILCLENGPLSHRNGNLTARMLLFEGEGVVHDDDDIQVKCDA